MNNQQTFLWAGNTANNLQQSLFTYLNQLINIHQNPMVYEQILKKEHPWIIWLYPAYTTAMIDEILEQTRFKLESEEYRFFIFDEAHTLNDACANRLLKSIEEPHPGYYFLFCTNKPGLMLPTISSRCIHKFIAGEDLSQSNYHEILQPFLHGACNEPLEFSKLIEKYKVKEIESYQLFDQLFAHWSSSLHESMKTNNQALYQKSTTALDIIQHGYKFLPMAGSSKLFWKHLYVLFHQKFS